MSKLSISLYSRQEVANIVSDMKEAYAEAQRLDREWWKDSSVLTYGQALEIWEDRLTNYAAYEKAVRDDAAALGADIKIWG